MQYILTVINLHLQFGFIGMTSEDGDTKKGMNNTCVFGANKREINLMVIRAWTLKKRRNQISELVLD
jgi:hypothetical protein